MTNLSNIDFNLYSGSQAQRKLIFAIRDTYAISGMLVDSSHCLGITTIEDSDLTNELYHKIRLLCNKETLLIRKTTIPEMIHRFEYEQTLISQKQYCLIGHLTEHFLAERTIPKSCVFFFFIVLLYFLSQTIFILSSERPIHFSLVITPFSSLDLPSFLDSNVPAIIISKCFNKNK